MEMNVENILACVVGGCGQAGYGEDARRGLLAADSCRHLPRHPNEEQRNPALHLLPVLRNCL